jgi:amidohydrolase
MWTMLSPWAVPALLWLASGPVPDAEIKAAAERVAASVVATRRDLHAHPEVSNREERTGRLVAERLRTLGLEVRHPVARTGVVGVLRGGRPGPVVALRADIDALPMAEVNDVPYKSTVPGVMHACGHDAHTAMLLGAAEVLAGMKASLPGTVVFLFQPAEEGAPEGEEGGAPLMVKEGALDDPKPVAIFGLHVGLGTPGGRIGIKSGPLLASSDTFQIEILGRRVHGATPHKGLDPIPVAASMVSALQAIVSRELDSQNPKILTIGQIHGGTRNNILADKVTMDGTIRTFDPEVRSALKERMARTVKGVAEAHGTTATLRFLDDGNPATVNDAALTTAARPALERALGKDRVVDLAPRMVAEDFPFYTEKVPGLFLFLGTENAARGITSTNHAPDFDVDEDVLPIGVRALATLAWSTLAR